jgi:DNA-binding transcriptional LysR family regulator
MIPCTLRQLEIFLEAAEDCHFARTADRLGISQPAVTSHIASLEGQLGKRLFVRRRGTTPLLSSDGVAFVVQARTFLAEGEKISAFRSATSGPAPVRVRAAVGAHLLEDVVRPRLSEFYRDRSDIAIDCTLSDTIAKGLRMVERRQADVCLFSVGRTIETPLVAEVVRPIRFGLYASPAFAAHRSAGPAEISALPFVLPQEGGEPARAVETALAEVGVVCAKVARRAQFSDVILDLAAAGVGVASAFETMAEDRVRRGELIRFDLELPPRRRILFRRDEPPSPALEAVAAFLRRILRD